MPVDTLLALAARTDLGDLRWVGLPPAWLLTLAALAIFAGLRALYVLESGRAGLLARLGLAALRTVVLVLLLLVLAGPYREEVKTVEERSHLVLLVDSSASMQTADRYLPAEERRLVEAAWPSGPRPNADGPLQVARLDLVKRVLAPEGEALLRRLDQRFILHVFAFDQTWRTLGSTRADAPGTAEPPDVGEAMAAMVEAARAEMEGDEVAAAEALALLAEDPVAAIAGAVRGLVPQGGTRIGHVLRSLAGEFLGREDRRLAGVLLLSDGRDTSEGEPPLEALAALGATRSDLHVTAVALGTPVGERNARVTRVRAKDVVLTGDRVTFETALRHQGFTGLEGVRVELSVERLTDAEDNPVTPRPYDPGDGEERVAGPLRLEDEGTPLPLRFRARFLEPGTFRVTIRAILPEPEASEDAVAEDDVAWHDLRVVDQRIKVLYVDHLPRYDWRFLSNYITREPESDPARPRFRRRYEAHVLLQSADPTVEQRASPGLAPLRGFPRTRSELFQYDVIILGDVDWTRLGESVQESREMLALVRDFVEAGGGLALQAGENYDNPLAFRETPLQDLVPVTLRDRDENASQKKDAPFHLLLTEEGARHPVFGVVPGPEGETASPEELARVWGGEGPYSREWIWYWLYRATGGVRPGVLELAHVRPVGPQEASFQDDRGRPLVALATMGFGKGRVFWSGLDSLSRLRRRQSDVIYGAFWDQVIRYLATYRLLGGNKRFKISADRESYFVGDTARITITALDRDFMPMIAPYLDGVHLEFPDGVSLLLEGDDRPFSASPEEAAPGTYLLHLPIRASGTYRLWIPDPEAGGLGNRAELRFAADYRTAEMRQTLPNHDLLREIVRETGGILVEGRLARLYDLESLADTLPSRTTRRVLDRQERTQWDKPWVLLLLTLLLGLEWFLRKRAQMV